MAQFTPGAKLDVLFNEKSGLEFVYIVADEFPAPIEMYNVENIDQWLRSNRPPSPVVEIGSEVGKW